jgi:23S rRNA (uracil1939-C5)-methyltransferase
MPPRFDPESAAPLSSRGSLEEVVANVRVNCEHAEPCGGCPIIALAYGEQLALKRGRVVQSVARYTALELTYTEPVVPAEPVAAYRTRAKLIVAPGGKIGLYAKGGGHQIVDIPSCRVLSPTLSEITALLRRLIAEDEAIKGPLAAFEVSGGGALRAIDLREVISDDTAEPKVLLTLVVQRSRATDLAPLKEAASKLASVEPRFVGIAVNFHEGEAPQILGSETVVLYGEKSVPDRVGASTHLATFGSFVQAHRGQAGRVHAMLVDALSSGKRRDAEAPRILDLYGGSGSIALSLAQAGARVMLVESFPPAVEQAKAAAARAGLELDAECGDVARTLRDLAERKVRFTSAVVNPPRRGMSPTARELLTRLELDTIAYVSCDPDTLARDLDHFNRLGFTTTHLRPLDMIPLTDEVETVAILRHTSVPWPRVVFEDDEVIIVEKGPHEPVTPQSEYAGSLLARVRKISGAEAAVPVHRLDVGTSGLVLFARNQDKVAAWNNALNHASARKIYVAGVRGITPTKGAITRDLREDGVQYQARTRYRRLAVASGHSVLRVIPEQGRPHQIRRHLAAIGHPVLGDDRYGHAPTNRFFEEKNTLDRTFLHCVRLELEHPVHKTKLLLEAPLPGDLRGVLERAGGPGTLRFLDQKSALGTSTSSFPPPPDSGHVRGSAIDLNLQALSIPPDLTTDDDDRGSGGF